MGDCLSTPKKDRDSKRSNEDRRDSLKRPYNRAKDRLDAIPETKTIERDGIVMRYAYVSQRGFYPDDPFKANQDAYCVHETLSKAAECQDTLFGVFDGHGNDGDGCAIFTKKHIGRNLAQLMEKNKAKRSKEELTKDEVQAALLKAHTDTNKQLRRDKNIDDSLSGTTAISIYFHGRKHRMTVSNVGDSRAILGQEINGTLKAQPLSRDQTPYRKDERKRIKKTGARVMSLDQLEGLEQVPDESSDDDGQELVLGEELDEGGDPPRVWSPAGNYPGTAFTRSIGDAMAEDLGVFAEPEMLTREVTPEDKMMVIASDGVFEFLTNQSVIDICAKFADPLEACRAVVAEAYELWLQYEMRTDDITIICIFVDSVKESTGRYSAEPMLRIDETKVQQNMKSSVKNAASLVAAEGSSDVVVNAPLPMGSSRPVRKHATKEKSKAIEKMKEMSRKQGPIYSEAELDWTKLAKTEKTTEEKRLISNAIKASVMFRNITDEQKEMIFSCMESVKVKSGEWVIRQGTEGDRFYIIDQGHFQVRIVPVGEKDVTGDGGHVVHEYEGSRERDAHPAFGELALMYSAPRSASIIALTDGHLWALHRSAFRQVLIESRDHRKALKKTLAEIPYFKILDSDGINKLSAIMDDITVGRGENIVEQDKEGQKMYVINTGSCCTIQKKWTTGQTERSTLKAGGYFGDEILSSPEDKDATPKYSMTVVSLQTTACWVLDVQVLKQTMGPLLLEQA